MAHLTGSLPQVNAAARGESTKSIRDLALLRLVTGSLLILVALVGWFGGNWDIQWHAVIGRDRTFTPPHDLILIGIGLSGIVALISILIETRWLGRQRELRAYSSDFLGVLHSSLGYYLVGFGAVCSAIAFPLDTYWHSLYGIDVSLWAPFHTMIYMGGILSQFGVIYLMLSTAHLSEMQQDHRTASFSYACVAVLLGILLSKLSTFVTPTITSASYSLHLAAFTVNLFPLLTALVAIFICVLAVRLLPWVGAATMVVVVSLVLLLLLKTFIPPLMTILAQAEHQTYLARASRIGSTIVPLLGQTPLLLLTSLSIDGVVWLARRNRWTATRQQAWVIVAAAVSILIVTGFTLVQIGLSIRTARAGHAGGNLLAIVLALILTVPGSLLGAWLASKLGDALQTLRG